MAKTTVKTLGIRRKRVEAILPILRKTYPTAKCSLNHRTPLQLLVATILSAQCTDERVNVVTRDLFRKYKSAADYAGATEEQLGQDIRSTGFYRNKSRNIRAMAASLVQNHRGQVPQTMDELTALAGVGRKTANVVLGNAFGQNVGIVVDTHVSRLSQRLELTSNTDPQKIELDLIEIVPREDWTLWSHLLIFHGRQICIARQPRCEKCPILTECPTGPKILSQRQAADKGNAKKLRQGRMGRRS
jgi:endonuclease III